jgi:hypothetical protein
MHCQATQDTVPFINTADLSACLRATLSEGKGALQVGDCALHHLDKVCSNHCATSAHLESNNSSA